MLESLEEEEMILGDDLGCDLESEWIRWGRRKDVSSDTEKRKGQNVEWVVSVVVMVVTESP